MEDRLEKNPTLCSTNGDVSTPFSRPSANLSAEGEDLIFSPPSGVLDPWSSRRFQPSSRVTRPEFIRLLKRDSCVSDTSTATNPRGPTDFRESKGHQIELRGFASQPRGRWASLESSRNLSSTTERFRWPRMEVIPEDRYLIRSIPP